MQVPSNMLLTRVRPSLYIPFWVCVWSCLSATTAAVHNFQGLIVVRFFLGVSEAPFFPGVYYLLSCWYTKKELALRYAIPYSGLVLATAFSGLLAAGIFAGLENALGLAGWQWLFIIEGAASFAIGIAAFFLLPDFLESKSGSTQWLFNEDERQVSIDRIMRDAVSNQEKNHSIAHGLKLAVTDMKVFLFVSVFCPLQASNSTMAKVADPFIPGAHFMRQPKCLWIQLLLPCHRSGIQPRGPHYYSCLHRPSLHHWRSSILLHSLVK